MTRINALKYIFLSTLILVVAHSSPNDYVWINYNAEIPVKNFNSTLGIVGIPCEVRIGSCKITYSMLPPGWTATTDGKVLVPLSDTTRIAGFSMKATLASIFDDQIEADLVGFFQNGAFTVKDRAQFLRASGYSEAMSSVKPLQNKVNIQIKKNIALDGFPSLDELEYMIKFANIYTVSSKLKEVSEKYAPCPDRVQYLSRISDALKNKIAENELITNAYQQEINNLRFSINDLESQKKEVQNRLSMDKNFLDIQKSLINLNSSKKELQSNLDKYDYLSNRYLEAMNNLSLASDARNNKTQEQLEIVQLEDEVKKWEQVIADAMEKKRKLEETIKAKRAVLPAQASAKPQENEAELMSLYESKYREYSDLALTSKIQMKSIDQQLASLTARYNIRNSDVSAIDKKINDLNDKLKEKQAPQAVQAQEEQLNINQIFKLSSDNMKNKISLLTASQCGYG